MTALPHIEATCKLCSAAKAKATYKLHQTTLFCCPCCDLHFIDYLDPPASIAPPEKPLSDQARGYIDLRQDESALLHPLRLRLVQQHLSSPRPRLLDIGAGTGQFQRLATAEMHAESYGIEPSSLRRQYALEQFELSLFKELVEDPFWQTSFSAYFDLITLWDVLEHVNNPRQTLSHAVKLLKPGGIIAIDTPNRNVFPYRLSETAYRLSRGRCSLFLDSFYAAVPFGHKQIFTRQQLSTLFTETGLNQVSWRYNYASSARPKKRIIMVGIKT